MLQHLVEWRSTKRYSTLFDETPFDVGQARRTVTAHLATAS
jgi:hypothetical protein